MFPVPSCFSCISVPLFSAASSNSKSPKQDWQVQFQKLFPYSLQIEILRLVPPKHTRLSQSCPYFAFHCDLNPIKSLFAKRFPKYLPSLGHFLSAFLSYPSWSVNLFPIRKCFLQKLSPFIWAILFLSAWRASTIFTITFLQPESFPSLLQRTSS